VTEPPGQPPYGSYPPNQYGAPQYGGFGPPDHQQALLVLILGILGFAVCLLISPFAWVIGNRVVAEIDASNGRLGGRSMANAGRICGIVGTLLIGFVLLAGIAGFAFFFVTATETG
jgi:hypothetical protein